MRLTISISLVFVGIALSSCSDGDDSDGVTVDAAPSIDAVGLPSTCSTEQQNCPTGYKCTLTMQMTQPPIIARCVRLQGEVAEGAACQTSGADPLAFGHDNCAAGFYCHQNVCRRLCLGSSVCGTDQACTQYATASDGLCRERCELVTPGECPSGETCDSFMTLDDLRYRAASGRLRRVYRAVIAGTFGDRARALIPPAA